MSVRTCTITDPVPLPVTGTVAVSGTVDVASSAPLVVRNADQPGRNPYQHRVFLNQDNVSRCTQFVCRATFPAVPPGKRLVITHASARWVVTQGGAEASITHSANPITDGAIIGPPTPTGFNSFIAAGPVMYFVDEGDSPVVSMAGQFVTASNTAEASVVGYLVAVP